MKPRSPLSSTDIVTPVILTVGLQDLPTRTTWGDARLVAAHTVDDVLETFARERVALFVLGPLLNPSDAHRLLTRRVAEFRASPALNIVCGVGAETALFQDCIDRDSLFYLARGALTDADLVSLAGAALNRAFAASVDESPAASIDNEFSLESLREFHSRVSMQENVLDVADIVVETARGLLSADNVRCLIVDEHTDALWSRDSVSREEMIESASSGLVGYVARTGERILLGSIANDPRYDPDADNPSRSPDVCFLAEPVFSASGAVAAVIAGVRRNSVPFSAADSQILKQLACSTTPVLSLLLLGEKLRRSSADHLAARRDRDIYREEALEHHARGAPLEGHLLKSVSSWVKWVHGVAVGGIVAVGLGLLMFMRVDEYASGAAVVRPRVQIALTAATAAVVRSVDVVVGQRVAAGALLVHTVRPGDHEEEPLWAPAEGVVASLTARPGQWLAPGDTVATIVDASAGYEVIVVVPASYEPRISPGMSLALRLHGYGDSSEVIPIEHVGPVILNRTEAAPYTGDLIPVTGPLVVLRARLPKRTFGAAGRRYPYRSGLTGDADVTVDTQSALTTLIPALKGLTTR
jgi:hypothetical protein